MADIVDYSGKPFLGKYFLLSEDSKVLIEFSKDKCTMSGTVLDYTATDNGDGTYLIDIPLFGESYPYTATTDALTFPGETSEPSIPKADSTYAIVTLTTTNSEWDSQFGGEYAIKKGEAFNTVFLRMMDCWSLILPEFDLLEAMRLLIIRVVM